MNRVSKNIVKWAISAIIVNEVRRALKAWRKK